MSERTKGPWKWHSRVEGEFPNQLQTGSIYAEPTKGHAYSVAVAPRYQTEEQWKADAAAIVRWENHFDELVSALDLALGFIDPDASPPRQSNREAADQIRAVLAKVKES